MSEASGGDRRRHVRVGVEFAARIRLGEAWVDYPSVFTRDVSFGGIGLEIAAKWREPFDGFLSGDDPVDVEIDLPPGRTVRAKAVAVWGHAIEPEGSARRFRVGLRFVEMTEADRSLLLDFVRSKTIESLLKEDMDRRMGKPSPDGLP